MKSLLLLLTLSLSVSFGQMTRGTLLGTVTDLSGAVVPNVMVKATNTETSISKETSTNESGIFRLPAVEPGIYELDFTKEGFATRKAARIEVRTAQEVTVNPTLELAAVSSQVQVVEGVAGVELAKSSATFERTFQSKLIEDLPMTAATRDVNQLAMLAPTVARGPGSTGMSANGQRARNNNFMLDGVDNNDPSVTLPNIRVIPEAVSEFQVQTSPYSAEFGRASGGQISVITKNGTNAFHGNVFDYFRAQWLEPLSLINKRAGLTERPRFNSNQAGGSLGGPVIKNKTFFFAIMEANRFRQAPDARNSSAATIPTAEGYRLLSTAPLADGQPANSRHAVLSAISFLPGIYATNPAFSNLRTVSANGLSIPVGTINIPLANPSDFWYGVGRIDHQLTSRDSLTYRYVIDDRNQPSVVSNLQFGDLFSGAQTIRRENHSAAYTRTFNSRMVNEFRFAYVKSLLDFPENDPKTATTSITGLFTIGGLSNFPQGRSQDQYQLQDTLTYTVGRHTIKAGFNFSYLKLFNNAAFNTKGVWSFDNLQDFLNNRAASLQVALDVASFDARQKQQAYFVQDDFKVSRTLTLNLGLRYETAAIPFGAFGETDPAIRATLVPGPSRNDRNNWGPRVGFAYSPNGGILGHGQTVIRGGYGMTYDYLFFNILTVNGSNYPRVRTALLDRPVNLFPSQQTGTAPGFNPLLTFVNSPENLQSPTAHIWSFSIQREVAGTNIFEVGYSGTHSYFGIRQGQANPGILTDAQAAAVRAANSPNAIPTLQARRAFPAFGSRVLIESTAVGSYNAVFVKYDRKLSKGLTAGANYTFSSNLSDNDESLGVGAITTSSPQVPQDFRNYRPEYSRSVFDRPHRASLFWNYEAPWFKTGNGLVRRTLGGWNVSGAWDAQSGQPFTILTGVDTYGTGSSAARPDLNAKGIMTADPVSGDLRTFTLPLDGTGRVVTPLSSSTGLPLANSQVAFGNLGRNTFRGPIFQNLSLSFMKRIAVTEAVRVSLRFDMIDALNHRNFGNPVTSMASPIFGTNITDPGARSALASLKVEF